MGRPPLPRNDLVSDLFCRLPIRSTRCRVTSPVANPKGRREGDPTRTLDWSGRPDQQPYGYWPGHETGEVTNGSRRHLCMDHRRTQSCQEHSSGHQQRCANTAIIGVHVGFPLPATTAPTRHRQANMSHSSASIATDDMPSLRRCAPIAVFGDPRTRRPMTGCCTAVPRRRVTA